MDGGQKYENPSPELKAKFFSKLFFFWIFPFLRYGYKNGIQMEDVYNISEKNLSGDLGDLLEKNWYSEVTRAKRRNKNPSLLRVIKKIFELSYMKLGLLLVFQMVVLRSLQPLILCEFLKFFQNVRESEVSIKRGWILGTTIVLINFVNNLVFQQYFVNCQIIGLRVKIACTSLVYRKILKLNHTSLSQTTSGKIINLLSNDVQRMEQAAVYFHYIYAVPLQFIVMTYVTYNIVGISCLPGLLFVVIEGVIVQGYLSKIQGKLRSKIVLLTGERLASMDDIISGIHVIKMYAWEKPFEKILELARKLELSAITKLSYTKGVTVGMVVFTERFCLFLTIMMHVLLGNKLSGDLVFSIAQVLNIIQASVCYYLPLSFESFTDIKLSISRLQEFLLLDEKQQAIDARSASIIENIESIKVLDVRAGWLPTAPTLTDISLNIRQGTLCCILGKVGAGKTSLLQLLLKELPASTGKVDVVEKICYASQEPWLFVASVRNNILFGQKFLQNKYDEVVKVCALRRDFQQFPYRDQTIVGERGVSLSGGQKARINLARAVYLDADLYLLDDPLSAVDAHVAKHLFEDCVKNYLKGRTRVLVTHQVQFLKQADLVVVLEAGKISNILTNDDISDSNLRKLDEVIGDENLNTEEKVAKSNKCSRRTSNLSYSSLNTCEQEIDEDAEMLSKDVSIKTYIKYFHSGTNICFLIFVFTLFVAAQVITNMTDLWIMFWSNEEQKHNSTISPPNLSRISINFLPEDTSNINFTDLHRSTNISSSYYKIHSNLDSTNQTSIEYKYLYIYSGLILSCISLSMTRPMLFWKVCLNASKALHTNMAASIMRAPIKFFETNPSGRIMNRFSKDIRSVDQDLPEALLWTFQIYLVILGIIVIVCILTPWIIVALLMATIAAYYIVALFLPTLLKLVKLEANNRSPIFSQISTTLHGLPTIRSAKAEGIMKKYFDTLQDLHTSTKYMSMVCCRSFCFYLELISNVLLGVVTFKYLIFKNENIVSGYIGLVLSQTSILSGILQYAITMTIDVINATVSVERILQYTNIDKEDSMESVTYDGLTKHWPRNGKIDFNNVSLTYLPKEPPVLKNINFSIAAKEKIGIVGRTGAGKSSLVSCLFRLNQIEGTITIDDTDINEIDLKTLRSNISIIPQEPVLFSASLRYNLDPLGKISDENLWNVLENVKLKDCVQSLDQKIGKDGSNFSVGQRQLICLARAIVRNNKILVMDEATANVDPNTDALIQRTIRENFKSCTVLTIAHRLNTIMDSDRVMVLNLGEVLECAHPHELLQKSNGYFLQLVQQTGKAMEAILRKMAREDFEKKFFTRSE